MNYESKVQSEQDYVNSEKVNSYAGSDLNIGGENKIYYLETDEIVEKLIILLRGLKWNDDTKNYVSDPSTMPYLNEKGANILRVTLDGIMHKGIRLTNFDDNKIKISVKNFSHAIVNLLCIYREEWDFDINKLTIVRPLIETNISATLNQAKEGWMGRFLQTTRKELYHESNSMNNSNTPGANNQNRSGMLAWLLRGRSSEGT